MIITATEVVQNTMAPSYHSKVISTQNKGVPFLSCLADGVCYYVWVKPWNYYSSMVKPKVSPIFLACQF